MATTGRWQLLRLWTTLCLLICLMGSVLTDNSICSNSNCLCKDNRLICSCKDGSDLDLVKVDNYTIQHVQISDCGKVTLGRECFGGISLRSLELRRLATLSIKGLAFVRVSLIDSILFEDIGLFETQKYSCHFFTNIDRITLRNISSDSLPADSFNIRELREFNLVDSTIRRIESNALRFVKPLSKVFLNGNSINKIEPFGFKFDDSVEDVSIVSNQLDYVETNGFVFDRVSNLVFQNCTFNELQSKFVKAIVTTSFAFKWNDVRKCESKSFDYLESITQTFIVSNRFDKMETNCLPVKTPRLIAKDNVFRCDCHLSWIWDSDFQPFFERGLCGNETGLIPINSFIPKYNSSGNCVQLINKNDYVDETVVKSLDGDTKKKNFTYFW